jgi:tRNA/rRNA methyltransferase
LTLPPSPAIVLVRPQLGRNIGACARAMLNFGLTDLRLVSPRDGWPNADAGPAASGADGVIDGARLFETIEAAVADCTLVLGTAMLTRDLTRRVLTPRGAVAEMAALPTQTALLFGPERTGLLQTDIALCHAIVSIPTNPDFASLNLAQAVVVMAYEWFMAHDKTPPEQTIHHEGPAEHGDLMGLIDAIDEAIAAHGYYNPAPGMEPAARRMLRNIFTRPAYTAQEVRTLRGIVRALIHPRRRAVAAKLFAGE